MNKLALGLLAVCAAVILVAVPPPQDSLAQGDTKILKFQASFPPSSLIYTNMLKFAEGVEQMSGGRV